MASEPDHYRILGVEPTADQAAIDAAYQAKALRFRLARLRDPERTLPGPSQEETAQAYRVLGNPEARARYDAAHFPAKGNARPRALQGQWRILGACLAAIAVVCVIGAWSRLADASGPMGRLAATADDSGPIGRFISTEAATTPSVPVATPTAAPTTTLTATPIPATATLSPAATPRPPAPAPPPPTATPLAPTPTPVFGATDRIGAPVPVNLRGGPGTIFAILGVLPPGTLLAATGESATAGGFVWRRFRLADGRVGWVRDADVLPAP